MLIEISSYPKSGNTWMRYILATLFDIDVHRGIPDFHQQGKSTADLINWVQVRGEAVGFYKSHITECQFMAPDRIIGIYRHPLDVFLSCLNYFYITGKNEAFFDSRLLSVDELYELGHLSLYFDEFFQNAGGTYYPELLGSSSNYFVYMDRALSNEKVLPVKYESLYDRPVESVRSLLDDLLGFVPKALGESLFEKVNSQTKEKKDGFFWKSRKQNYKHYLTESQIVSFSEKYGDELARLGY